MLPPEPARSVGRYLAVADRLLPGRIVGFYVVGSTALGAFRPERSDIDFVAVVDGHLTAADLRSLRLVQAASGLRTGARAVLQGRWSLPGTCNGVYVAAEDLRHPVSTIVPLASHCGVELSAGTGFDVNPVMWKVFAERGITVRGPEPTRLGLDPQPELLRAWNRENLETYWRRWAEATRAGRRANHRLVPARWVTAWGVLGPPRLHHTIATGEVVSKEQAGAYALDTFDRTWHPLVREALAYWRCEPADATFANPSVSHRLAGELALEVIASAREL